MSPQRKQQALTIAKVLGPLIIAGLVALGVSVTTPEERFSAIEARQDTADRRLERVEEMHADVDAMALSLCLEQKNAIARQFLKCGQREARAGVRAR